MTLHILKKEWLWDVVGGDPGERWDSQAKTTDGGTVAKLDQFTTEEEKNQLGSGGARRTRRSSENWEKPLGKLAKVSNSFERDRPHDQAAERRKCEVRDAPLCFHTVLLQELFQKEYPQPRNGLRLRMHAPACGHEDCF